MINLIPTLAKKEVSREYWLRVVSVWMILLSFFLLITTALNLPTLILVNSLEAANQSRLNEILNSQNANKDAENLINDTNALIKQVNITNERAKFSELMYILDDIAGNEVVLTQFTFEENAGLVQPLTMIGWADSRVSLAKFREVLEQHESFEKVELPISNLAKDRDITFSMTVSYIEPKN
jgi:hypothetical protein